MRGLTKWKRRNMVIYMIKEFLTARITKSHENTSVVILRINISNNMRGSGNYPREYIYTIHNSARQDLEFWMMQKSKIVRRGLTPFTMSVFVLILNTHCLRNDCMGRSIRGVGNADWASAAGRRIRRRPPFPRVSCRRPWMPPAKEWPKSTSCELTRGRYRLFVLWSDSILITYG